ncbi:MAG: O-methyltransferase [Proteobacteria bacterium]|nr:O-methyltransferase [Pseudomonadota bacterium]
MSDPDSRTGKRYATEAILAYLDRIHAGHDTGLEAAFTTPEREGIPAIMVSPSEGRLLELILRMIAAKKVVEIGTLVGYSAIRMAAALPAHGKLWSIEADPKHAEVARRNIAAAGCADRVEVVEGPARDILSSLEVHGPFDAVFVDADKGSYDHYGTWAEANLRQGGLLLGDNAHLFGNLLDESDTARAMRRFHERAAQVFHSTCIPTPDGLLLAIKK